MYQPLSARVIFVKFNHPSSLCSTGGGPLSETQAESWWICELTRWKQQAGGRARARTLRGFAFNVVAVRVSRASPATRTTDRPTPPLAIPRHFSHSEAHKPTVNHSQLIVTRRKQGRGEGRGIKETSHELKNLKTPTGSRCAEMYVGRVNVSRVSYARVSKCSLRLSSRV